jgi:hypothetical protein
MMDQYLLTVLKGLDPGSWAMILLLAVILAPMIYRLRLRIVRVYRQLFWLSLGVAIGIALCHY